MALFGLGVVVAPILGPTLGALLNEHFSWRAVFYVNLPVAAFALFMMAGELQSEPAKVVTIDWTGLVLMVAAIGALQLMLDQGEMRSWFASPLIQILALVALVSATAFVVRALGLRAISSTSPCCATAALRLPSSPCWGSGWRCLAPSPFCRCLCRGC